jgi:hypothetical protein
MPTFNARPSSPVVHQTINDLVAGISFNGFEPVPLGELVPFGPGKVAAVNPADIPTRIDQLSTQLSRAYDLSVTAAAELNIPVVGSVSGGYSRRVVVLERTAFKNVADGMNQCQYGYAIRLVLTVNKLTADMKLTLPFLAASAEMGQLEAKWTLQVLGLSGSKIDEVSIAPTELNVETFVLAKQSLTNLIGAIRDSTTTFTAELISVVKPAEQIEHDYRTAVGVAYALGRLEKGRKRGQALNDLGPAHEVVRDTLVDVYKEFAGITGDSEEVQPEVRVRAGGLLSGVKVEPK